MATKKAPMVKTPVPSQVSSQVEDWGNIETQPETQPIPQREAAKVAVKGDKLVDEGQQTLTKSKSLRIVTQADYVTVIEKLKEIRSTRSEIDATFDPIISATHKAHKEALAQKKRVDAPWAEADTFLTRLTGDYNREQYRLQQEREEAIRKDNEARILAAGEEERLRQATELSERGDFDGAAEAIDAPIAVPMISVKVESTVPKLDGISNRKTYRAQVVDKRKLLQAVLAGTVPWEAIDVNMAYANGQARLLKREGEILPGVVSVMEISTGVTL